MKTSRNARNNAGQGVHSGKRKNKDNIFRRRTFAKYMQVKLAITVILISLALFALVFVLYRIVNENSERYNKIVLSQRQQEYASRTIPYRRGDIVDRNGTYLATSEKVYNLILDPSQIMDKPEYYLEPTIQALVDVFGFDANELRGLIQERSKRAYLRYKNGRQLSYDQKSQFEETEKERNAAYRKSDDDNQARFRVTGVWFEDEYRRIYPYDSTACNVIGFASGDGSSGTGGIEQYYNDSLIGVNGREYGYLDEDANLEGVVKSAVNGKTIVSTIDVNVQNILQKYIDEWQTSVGSHVTAAIAMNPNNGEVLGMATSNKFDLNDPRNTDGFSEEELLALGKKEAVAVYHRENPDQTITEDQALDHYSREDVISYGKQVAWNQLWRNFCVSDTYEPGSPSKILTVAAGLEEGVLKGNEYFDCGGYLHVGDWDIKCTAYRRGGHGSLSLTESIMQSCNVAMMRIGAMMGRDVFAKYQAMFGMGQKTGIDLPGEADAAGLVYPADKMGPTELATNAFGQNYNCTMIQMAAALCSVIHGGSYYEPHVVRQILNEQGSVVETKDPVLVRETVSQSTADFLKEAMFQTVENGTGGAAKVAGYQVGGKTGTAEKQPRSAKNYLVSFAGFAPVDDPQLFVYVVVDVPDFPPGDQQAHSSFASNIFAKIMSEALPYLNVFPDGDLPEESQDPNGQTPSEGINTPASEDGANGENGETQPEETTKVYETDEYVDIDGGSGIPDAVPANADGTEESSAQVTFPDAGEATVPAQTDPEESAPDEFSEGAVAETESTENTQDQDPTQTQPPGV